MWEIITIKKSFLFVLTFWFLTLGICHSDEKKTDCGMPFPFFLDNMREKAIKSGISSKTVSNVILNTEYLEEVIKLDRNQIAFRSSFTDFSNRSVNEYRLLHGQKKVEKYESLFNEIWRNYGIPPEVIVSFWAMETDYGEVQGNFHTLSALGTLANDCRRSELFQGQYLSAMKLVENKMLNAKNSFGAWAGEFGQIQMLPSDIIAYGADGDGDGKVQLGISSHDTILTAAKLILSKGWIPRQPWMQEVELREDFPWQEAGLGRSRPIKDWLKLGVRLRKVGIYDFDSNTKASLILPQGRKGPQFLIYPNFNVFMKWNNSFLYSTTAAYLANRLGGESEFISQDPEDILSFDQMIDLQEILYKMGYEVGKVDGILGAKTRQSVRIIQINLGLPADSWPTTELLRLLKSIGVKG